MTIDPGVLDPGEELIWSGRPSPMWLAIRRGWWFLIFGVLLVGSFISFLVAPGFARLPAQTEQSLNQGVIAARAIHTWGAVVGAGLLLFFGWLWRRAARTTYLLTNRRIVVDAAGPMARRMSIPLEHLRFIDLRSRLVGPADLTFNETRVFGIEGWGPRREGFLAVPDAAQVERMVRAAIDQTFATRGRGPWQ
jgi:hypothetical protein